VLERVSTPDGQLELRQRGERDFLITQDGRVLMNAHANRSELALGERAAAALAAHPRPRLLIGGLGMGCTLRAALDGLPAEAQVTVAELNPVIAAWCRGPLAALTGGAVEDPRVEVWIGDVARRIALAAEDGPAFDGIALDLYEGPAPGVRSLRDPHFGEEALRRCRGALAPGGLLAIWAEDPDPAFVDRLRRAGFEVHQERPGRGGRRHVVYLATLAAARS
jgi:spermidine synthase